MAGRGTEGGRLMQGQDRRGMSPHVESPLRRPLGRGARSHPALHGCQGPVLPQDVIGEVRGRGTSPEPGQAPEA